MISWYRKNISKPNSCANRLTSIFTPLHRHIIGFQNSRNSDGHIQTTITLLIFIENIQNLCSNSRLECLLSKTLRSCPKIPNHLKIIVKTVTEGNFSTHFLSDYGSWKSRHERIFLPKIWFQDYWSRDIGKIFPSQIRVRIVRLPFLRLSIST